MLWDVHEWFLEQYDYSPRLLYNQVENLGLPSDSDATADAHKHAAQQLNLFIRLVHEGYIDADLHKEVYGGPPFTSAVVRGLTERGLVLIGELPDPQERLIEGLEANIKRFEDDASIPPERKQHLVTAGRQAVEFVREVGAQGAANILFGG